MSPPGPSLFQERAYDDSDSSMSTSSASQSTVPSSVPSLEHESKTASPAESEIFEYHHTQDPRESVGTYCSTVVSHEELVDDDYSYYEPRPYGHHHKAPPPPQAMPSTPSEFGELFPSTRYLSIRHDDSTVDGNMNLRVDTNVAAVGDSEKNVTLFHLRMYDLKTREFSLRRYGRDCGREVAHIKRTIIKPVPQRPRLQRSVSKALHSFRGKAEAEPVVRLNRQDSGYSSSGFDEEEKEEPNPTSQATQTTNVCTLEFSNYAHVDLTRRGGKASKKYDFEYWGKSYSWKRVIKQVGSHAVAEEVSYQLANNSTGNIVAQIVPDPLSPAQRQAEEAKGGFVPPCSFSLRDSAQDPVISCLADVADVIMATGLTALVDDCIKRKFHKKKTVQLVLPVPMTKSPMKMRMEYVGPKRLIDEVFNRRPTLSRSQSTYSSRSTGAPVPVRTRTV